MVKRIMDTSDRDHRRGSRPRGNALATRLDRLITLVAQRRRIEAIERPLRVRVAAEITAQSQQGGPDQFRRPGGLISLVAPQPRWDIVDPSAFAGWLASNGHGHLVAERVVVTDHASLIALLESTEGSGRVSRRKLSACLDIQLHPRPDAPEHLDAEVNDAGRLITRAGEAIPGVLRVTREPWVQVCAASPTPRIDIAAGTSSGS